MRLIVQQCSNKQSCSSHIFAYVKERYTNMILNCIEWQLHFKGNSFEAGLRYEEVTDMSSESVLCTFKLFCSFLVFTSFIIKTTTKILSLKF